MRQGLLLILTGVVLLALVSFNESEAFHMNQPLSSNRIDEIADEELIQLACGAFRTLTEAQERAVKASVDAAEKRKLLLEDISKVATGGMMERYAKAWDNDALSVNLKVHRFEQAKLTNRIRDKAMVQMDIVGEVVDEAGEVPVQLSYQVYMHKIKTRWLINDINLDQ